MSLFQGIYGADGLVPLLAQSGGYWSIRYLLVNQVPRSGSYWSIRYLDQVAIGQSGIAIGPSGIAIGPSGQSAPITQNKRNPMIHGGLIISEQGIFIKYDLVQAHGNFYQTSPF